MNFFGMVTTRASRDYTGHALRSFFETTELRDGDVVLLIDNDGSYDSEPKQARLCVLKNAAPLSFAANVNQALRMAREQGADLFFLNNDLIFTPGWLEPLLRAEETVLSPVSNFQYRYQYGDFTCSPVIDLADYLGHEQALRQIVGAHRARERGYEMALGLPFFCVRIPYAVYSVVGELDEGFGTGGGEDYDYCLRCLRAGFGVAFALESYLLHFMGKSTWRGPETPEQRRQRVHQYLHAFRAKWGQPLLEMVAFHRLDAVFADPSLARAYQQGDYRWLIEQLVNPAKVPVEAAAAFR
jgi:GT2 family glycosyltransferase